VLFRSDTLAEALVVAEAVTGLDTATLAKVADLGLLDSRCTPPRPVSPATSSTRPSSTRRPARRSPPVSPAALRTPVLVLRVSSF